MGAKPATVGSLKIAKVAFGEIKSDELVANELFGEGQDSLNSGSVDFGPMSVQCVVAKREILKSKVASCLCNGVLLAELVDHVAEGGTSY